MSSRIQDELLEELEELEQEELARELLHVGDEEEATLKSYGLYSLQPKMEKLYTVSKNKTRS